MSWLVKEGQKPIWLDRINKNKRPIRENVTAYLCFERKLATPALIAPQIGDVIFMWT